jgi:P pilus assembly chaperone PapD
MLKQSIPQATFKLFTLMILAAGTIATGVEKVAAQISIAPTAVFMTDRSPFANVIVSNGSETPQEISISFRFGYSTSDQEGNVSMYYDTTGHSNSFVNHVNAFPRNFVLEPGQRQTVRLAARGYGNVDDGTYWSRMNILATPLSPPVEAETGDDAVAARININFEQVIPAFFKKGNVSTGLNVREIDFRQDNRQGIFLVDAVRTGNSPYIGSTNLTILDSNGEQMREQEVTFSAYFDIVRRINTDLSGLEPGSYTAKLEFRTDRRDISGNDLIQVETFTVSTDFSIE